MAPGYALKEQPVLLVTEPSLQSQHLLVPAQAPIFLNDVEIFYFVVCDQYLELEFNNSKSLAIFGSFFPPLHWSLGTHSLKWIPGSMLEMHQWFLYMYL